MTNLIARRSGSDFNLFADGVQFARLADCEVGHVFIAESSMIQQFVDQKMEADYSIREMLIAVRAGYDAWEQYLRNDADMSRGL